ncbi:DUF1850 domain-containing protein [Clostridiaceae bacterium HSG29]|nr:DUF1850 domain-containing protein [Clostridiaceae bacterium HSG29]
MKKTIFILLILLITMLFTVNINVLVLYHYQAEKPIMIYKIETNDEFTVKWIHSVELTPWEEIFRIDNNYNIILDRTRFQQFGAGVPDSAGTKTEIKDGYITFSGIDRKIDMIPYGISNFAKHTFIFKNKEYKLYEIVSDGDRINFYTDKYNLLKYLLLK